MRNSCAAGGLLLTGSLLCTSLPQKEFRFLKCILLTTLGFYVELTLGYLAKCGTAGDLEIARKEYDRSDYGTSRSALECMVGILLRTGQAKAAQELVLESQFETLNADLLRSVLAGFEGLETPALLLGLKHRNSQVRLRAMKSLHGRGALDIENGRASCRERV